VQNAPADQVTGSEAGVITLEDFSSLEQAEQYVLDQLRALYARAVAEAGAESPQAQEYLETISQVERTFAGHRRCKQLGVRCSRALLRYRSGCWWRCLMRFLSGRLRTDRPCRRLLAPLALRDRAPPWAPWGVLAPPAVPQLIARQ
jgi:hypothetical protein